MTEPRMWCPDCSKMVDTRVEEQAIDIPKVGHYEGIEVHVCAGCGKTLVTSQRGATQIRERIAAEYD